MPYHNQALVDTLPVPTEFRGPLPDKQPLRFKRVEKDQDAKFWLCIGEYRSRLPALEWGMLRLDVESLDGKPLQYLNEKTGKAWVGMMLGSWYRNVLIELPSDLTVLYILTIPPRS